jgi:hypothetical protein
VTPASRQRAAEDNAMATGRVDPHGAYGPNTCVAGFVWREAFAGDMVCVTPAVRSATAEENRLGQSRRVLAYGPDTCKQGFVWREAAPGDHVCVVPASRARAQQENALAASRVDPFGAYGPNTCLAGFVWREAFAGDVVCVTPDIRTLVRDENTNARRTRIMG